MAKSIVWAATLPVWALVLWLGGCKSLPHHPDYSCDAEFRKCTENCDHLVVLPDPDQDGILPNPRSHSVREGCAEACGHEYEKCSQGSENDN